MDVKPFRLAAIFKKKGRPQSLADQIVLAQDDQNDLEQDGSRRGRRSGSGQQHRQQQQHEATVVVSPLRSPDRRRKAGGGSSTRMDVVRGVFARGSSMGAATSRQTSAHEEAPSAPSSASAASTASSASGSSASSGGDQFTEIVLSAKDRSVRSVTAAGERLEMDIMVQSILSARQQQQQQPDQPERKANLMAVALIAFSAFVYSLQTLNVKLLGGRFDSWTSTLFRGMVGTLLCLGHALLGRRRRKPPSSQHPILGKPENRRLLLLRGLLGGLTIASAFFAVQAMDLAEASVLIFTAPLWTAVLSRAFGIGTWAHVDTLSAIACLCGMVMVTQPPFLFGGKGGQASFTSMLPGFAAALVSAVTAAGVNVLISKLKGEDASTITLYAMLGSIVVAFPGFCYHQLGPRRSGALWRSDSEAIAQLYLTGFLSWLAQMTKTSGLKLSKTMGVLVMRYLDIVFAFVWDVFFLHAALVPMSTGGAAIIVAGCMLSILVKRGG